MAEASSAETHPADPPPIAECFIPLGCQAVKSPITGSVWTVAVKEGDRVECGQRLLVIEAMKMEVAVAASEGGYVVEVRCHPGMQITIGQTLVVVRA